MDSHGHSETAKQKEEREEREASHAKYPDGHVKHEKDKVNQPKDNIVTFVGGNTDGKNLFMEVDVFDGEHTNKLYPVFPFTKDTEVLVDYAKELIEKDPQFPAEITGLMQTGILWDATQECWMVRDANGKATPEKKK